MTDNVYFGFSNVHVAFMTDESKPGSPKWEAFKHIPGAVNFSPDADISESVFNADNVKYFVSNSANGYNGDLEMAKFPDDFLVDALGWYLDVNSALIEVAEGQEKQFALAAQIEGDIRGRRVVFYCCSAGTPTREYSTDDGGKQVKTEKARITIIPYDLGVDLGGGRRTVTKAQLEYSAENATAWNNFFTTPYLPKATA